MAIFEYPTRKAKDLLKKAGESGTLASADVVGVTDDSKFHENLVVQELQPTASGVEVRNYRWESK